MSLPRWWIANVKVSRDRVEAEAPRIAQAVVPDLARACDRAYKKIVGRNRVVALWISGEAIRIDIDPKNLSNQEVEVLCMVSGSFSGPTASLESPPTTSAITGPLAPGRTEYLRVGECEHADKALLTCLKRVELPVHVR
jgi:hypothetical protein